jgi:hypothetical protein
MRSSLTLVIHSYRNPKASFSFAVVLSGESRKALKKAECSLRRTEWAWDSWWKTLRMMSVFISGDLKIIGGFFSGSSWWVEVRTKT